MPPAVLVQCEAVDGLRRTVKLRMRRNTESWITFSFPWFTDRGGVACVIMLSTVLSDVSVESLNTLLASLHCPVFTSEENDTPRT